MQWRNVDTTVRGGNNPMGAIQGVQQSIQGMESIVRERDEIAREKVRAGQDENSVTALEALLSADAEGIAEFDPQKFGDMRPDHRAELLQMADARSNELVLREAVELEAQNHITNRQTTAAANDFWDINGGQIEAMLADNNFEGARQFINSSVPEKGLLATGVRSRLKEREKAYQSHNATIARSRTDQANAERDLDRVRQSHNDDELYRSIHEASVTAGSEFKAQQQALHSTLIQEGIRDGLLDDQGRPLSSADPERLETFLGRIDEATDSLASERFQQLMSETDRIQNDTDRERAQQAIMRAFDTSLELNPEQEKSFQEQENIIRETAQQREQLINNAHEEMLRTNVFYAARADNRPVNERIEATVVDVATTLGVEPNQLKGRQRDAIVDLVTKGVQLEDGQTVPVTPELIQAFTAGRGYTADSMWFQRLSIGRRTGNNARIQLENWVRQESGPVADGFRKYEELNAARNELSESFGRDLDAIGRMRMQGAGYKTGNSFGGLQINVQGELNRRRLEEISPNIAAVNERDRQNISRNDFASNLLNTAANNPNSNIDPHSAEIQRAALQVSDEYSLELQETADHLHNTAQRSLQELNTVNDRINTLEAKSANETETEALREFLRESELSLFDERRWAVRDQVRELEREATIKRSEWRKLGDYETEISQLLEQKSSLESTIDRAQEQLFLLTR